MSATVLPRDDLKEHTGAVTALAAAGDGKTLLSGGEDGALRVWDGLTPRLVQEVKHGALVADVSFGAEGKLFASTGTNGAKLWWLSQSNYLAELKGERVLDDKLAEAERELAFAKGEAEFRKAGLKAAETNQTTVVARQKKAAATNDAIAKLFGEKQIALTNAIAAQRDADKALDELGADVRKLVEAWFVAERESTNAAALAKTAKDTSAKNADKLAAEVEAKTNLLAEAKAALENLPAETKAKQKSTTDKLIAANKAVIDAEKELKKLEPAKSATENEVHLAANALKRAEEVIAAAKSELSKAETGATNAVTIVDDAKKVLNAADQPIRSITFSENGGLILSLREDGALQKWTGENGVPCETSLHLPGARVVKALNAGRVLVASADAVSIWDIAPKWTLERMIGTGDVNSPLADRVNAIRFTPDGRQLITAGGEPSRGGEIKIWRVKDGTLVRELNNIHSDSVFALDVSADGKLLASGAADRFAKVTELNTGKVLKVFEGHTHHVLGVAWKRDQRTLLTAGADNVAKVWDASTGERRKNIEGFGKEVTAATFIGVGDEVVLTAGDGQVALVKDKGDKVRSFSGANDYVYATAVTPDGSVVVAGGADGVLRAWNGKDGKLLAEFAPRDLPPLR
jgi:WD40 repeat protein